MNTYRPPIMGTSHMVSAGHYLAAAAGYRIFEEGGNAIDAGVAAGIAINVTLPSATNFGGVAPIAIYDAASDGVITISGLGRWPPRREYRVFQRALRWSDTYRCAAYRRTGCARRVDHCHRKIRHDDFRAGRYSCARASGERLPGVGLSLRRIADNGRRPRRRSGDVAVDARNLYAEWAVPASG